MGTGGPRAPFRVETRLDDSLALVAIMLARAIGQTLSRTLAEVLRAPINNQGSRRGRDCIVLDAELDPAHPRIIVTGTFL